MNDDILSRSGMDHILADVLDAYKESLSLHKKTRNTDTKQAARRITHSLELALRKLAPLGYHTEKRLQKLKAESPHNSDSQ